MRPPQIVRLRNSAFALILIAAITSVATPASAAGDEAVPSSTAVADLLAFANENGALGVYFDSGTAVVVVPNERAADFPQADAARLGLSVKVQAAPITLETVASIRRDLLDLRATIPAAVSFAFFFDLRSPRMVVQTDGSASVFSTVSSKYAGHVEVVTGATVRLTADRQADTSAFWGGAKIVGGGQACTSGFVARSSTTTYMATAGHCFENGTSISSGGGFAEGTVTLRDFPTYEAEFYSGKSYAPRIYNGVAGDDASNVAILGRRIASVAVGQSGYCRTGWNSGRKCDWTVGSTDATFCPGWPFGWCSDHLYAFSGTHSSGGDSGGPIYKSYNGGALIVGTISGYTSTIFGTTNYGEKMGTVLERWHLTQVCSGTCVVQ